jgi:hypothetical protein
VKGHPRRGHSSQVFALNNYSIYSYALYMVRFADFWRIQLYRTFICSGGWYLCLCTASATTLIPTDFV